MLALLLGALSLFAAAQAQAQSVPTNVLTNGALDPHSLTVTPGDEKLDLVWTRAPGALNHWVQYKRRTDTAWTTSTSSLTSPVDIAGVSHSITGLTGGILYDVRIFGTVTSGGTMYRSPFVTGSGTPTGTSAKLSVIANPACDTTVSDMSVQPFWHLNLTPPPDTEQAVDYSPVNSGGGLLGGEPKWNGHLPVSPQYGGNSIESPRDRPFSHFRAAFRGFAGFKFRLRDDHSIEASCTWQFDGDDGGTQPDTQPTPDTGGTNTGGGGGGSGGGGGGGSGGGGGTPPSSEDSPLPEEPSPQDPDQSDDCGASDRENLVRFYEALRGDGWTENENWNSPEPLDQWFGVETDEHGEVVSLRLSENNLSGDMPAELLLCLSELKELALWGNEDLSGEAPEELVLAVERAVLRDIAEMLDLNPEWFENYGDPFDFEDWHTGVTTDDEGRVVELDLPGGIPESVSELRRLREVMTTRSSSDGGCALSPEGSSAFSLFLLTLAVFAALVRRRVRG